MAFLNLFEKIAKPRVEVTTVSTDPGINEHLAEINERLRKIETKQKETSLQLEEIDGFLQGDASADAADTENALVDALIALADTIGDFYYFAGQENYVEVDPPNETTWCPPNETERGFVLINPKDIEDGAEDEDSAEYENGIEDEDGIEDTDSPLFEQAQMMWNAAKNATETAGLEIIDAEREPFDFRLHSAESVEQDDDLPNGYVVKTLKCGYIYKGEVVRRAAVVVNKIYTPDVVYQEEVVDESWN